VTVVFALQAYYRAVRDDLAVRDPLVKSYFGWRKVARQNVDNQPCIIWVPGDESGTAGEDLPPIQVGGASRNVADLGEHFTVHIRAHDPSGPENDEMQYAIVRVLYDEWRASLYRAGFGIVRVGNPRWDTKRTERRLGASLIVPCTLRAPIPDDPSTAVSGVTAIINAALVRDQAEDLTADTDLGLLTDGTEVVDADAQGTVTLIPVDPSEAV
jgi:hypothetical protein